MGAISTATGGILTGVSTKVGAITSVAKGVMCLPQIFSPQGLQYLAANVVNLLSTYAASVITGLTNFVADTITRNIQNITGTIGSTLNQINNLLREINESITLIKTYLTSLEDRAKNILDFLLDGSNCNFAAAELAKCMISDILDEVPKSVTKSLADGTSDFNNKVLDVTDSLLGPSRSLNRSVARYQQFANRARVQQMF